MAQSVEDALVVRMETTLAKFEREMNRGRKVGVGTATDVQKAWTKSGQQIAANANRATSGLQRMMNVSRGGRFVIQNTANQIGDMAVQMEMGTNHSRIMSQQLPQLFGGLAALGGPLGLIGPLLGTVAALGLPVASALLAIGDGAETAEDQLEALEKSIEAVKTAQASTSRTATDLLSEYGELADEAQRIFQINQQIASIRAQGALDDVSRVVARELGVEQVLGFDPAEIRELPGTISRMADEVRRLNAIPAYKLNDSDLMSLDGEIRQMEAQLASLRALSKNVDDLADSLGLSDEAAQEVIARFAELGQANGASEQAAVMVDLVEYIKEASNNLVDAEEHGEALFDQLREAATKALELSSLDLASPVADAAAAAKQLKEELAAALALQNRINLQESKEYSGRGGDPRKVGSADYQNELGYESIDDIIAKSKPKRSRSKSVGRSADKGLREAETLYDRTRTEAEKYAAELERINDLHQRFPEIITADVRDRAVDALREASTEIGRMSERMARGFEDAFADFVSGAGDARSAARALASDLARMAIRSAVSQSGIGGIFGNMLSGLFGGAPSFATGTNFHAGGPARINEFGAEDVILPRGSKVIPAHKSSGGLVNGQMDVHVTVSVDDEGALRAFVNRTSQRHANTAAGRVAQQVPAIMQDHTHRHG